MTGPWIVHACLTLGLASALVAGVLLAFSDFVMRGLGRTAAAGGIEAMQQINRTVLGSAFLATFLALVPLSLGLAAHAWLSLAGAGRSLIIAAAGVYMLAVFAVTMAGNVPLNRRLDGMASGDPAATAYWRRYADLWTKLNHVRTVGAVATAALFLMAAASLA